MQVRDDPRQGVEIMPSKQIMRPCGWCKVPQSARDDRKHFAVCPKRPKQIVAAQKRLREFSEMPPIK